MAVLHQRGLELLVQLLDAANEPHSLSKQEMQAMLRETSRVLGDLLARDMPTSRMHDEAR